MSSDDPLSSLVRSTAPPPPEIVAHFFYTSPLPLDDPLSPVPPLTSTTTTAPPRPFSLLDNRALEEAWTRLQEEAAKNSPANLSSQQHGDRNEGSPRHTQLSDLDKTKVAVEGDSANPLRKDGAHGKRDAEELSLLVDDLDGANDSPPSSPSSPSKRRRISPTSDKKPRTHNAIPILKKSPETHASRLRETGSPSYGSSPTDKNTTGNPFIRVASRDGRGRSTSAVSSHRPSSSSKERSPIHQINRPCHVHSPGESSSKQRSPRVSYAPPPESSTSKSPEPVDEPPEITVPVGVSRLHRVRLPALVLEPIYWSPVNDVSAVIRGTWFYRDTWLPVEADVANRLEIGYNEYEVWTRAWQEELASAVAVGFEGEAKIMRPLWEEEPEQSRPATGLGGELRNNPGAIAEAAEEAAAANTKAVTNRMFPNARVIYKNASEAFILRPAIVPTTSRRPLAAIRRGTPVGTAVVRGFDMNAYERLHPKRKSATREKAQEGAAVNASGTEAAPQARTGGEISDVTDLVLVIHGIGQKLSERVESFNFTHAVNSFRRLVNIEMRDPFVKHRTRKNFGGLMILPVNWRSTLSFDGQSPGLDETAPRDPAENHYTLTDITFQTLPAVRRIVGDVMLDIPYYLSQHKEKVVAAVIKEANRVYRLWCKNNPGFEKSGRVHLIAHSLGSAIAMDILSQQPTRLPKEIALESRAPEEKMFEFDTTNMFGCGSPAGFFLLLNRKSLLPRRGLGKIGANGDDMMEGVAGRPGAYGCVAVDNIYNVVHASDPIAYRLNPAVDAGYAASLQPALIPSTMPTFLESWGAAFRFGSSNRQTMSTPAGVMGDQKPNIARLPSAVELETHDFTHEEIAEKRMYLLNDNGQVDFILRAGGGALDIEYLNMLSAHSSYWYSRDFARFLVIEIARKQGRDETVPALRPVKKKIV